MALLKIWQVSRAIMRLLVIQFVCWLGWFSTFALAQPDISEGLTGSLDNFPALGITCVGNLAVLVTSLIRGRVDLEMGARDVLDILSTPKLQNIKRTENGYGLTTCKRIDSAEGRVSSTEQEHGLNAAGVIILSNGRPNWSMRQFIKSNAHLVHSVILQFLPLHRARDDAKVREELTAGVTIGACVCSESECNCIVFWTVKQITSTLARRMPGTLKPLTDSLCLLPCSTCLTNGCHGCNPESLLREQGLANEGQSVVSNLLEECGISPSEPICICIPMNDAREDNWTELLLRSLRSKDAEGRGVRNMATEALEGYLAGRRGSEKGSVEYDIFSFVVPRLTEVLMNLVLTFWYRVDGFSSAVVARRTVRDYLVDTKSSGFAANAFLTKAVVKSNADNSQVCQVLTFRGRDWLCKITFMSVGCVNLICALGWALLIFFKGASDTSQPPSLSRVAVIIAAIGSPWVMFSAALIHDIDSLLSNITTVRLSDFLKTLQRMTVPRFVVRLLDFLLTIGRWFVRVFVLVGLILVFVVISPVLWPGLLLGVLLIRLLVGRPIRLYATLLIATCLLFEMVCFVSWIALAGALGRKGFGRWVWSALQILTWVRWAMGSYFLNKENSIEFLGRIPNRALLIWYSSAFWLNAVLAGVRCEWEAWPWKHTESANGTANGH